MKKIKSRVVRARITDKKFNALRDYCKEKNTTASKLIDDFLSELLKDKLKDWFELIRLIRKWVWSLLSNLKSEVSLNLL